MSGNIMWVRPIFLDDQKGRFTKTTFKAIKQEQLIFTKVSGKIFLKSYKAQNKWQYQRTTTIYLFWTI